MLARLPKAVPPVHATFHSAGYHIQTKKSPDARYLVWWPTADEYTRQYLGIPFVIIRTGNGPMTVYV